MPGPTKNLERVAEVLGRHLDEEHGFRGLRLEVTTPQGQLVAYRVLPAPFNGAACPAGDPGEGPKLRVVPLDSGGRPLPTGARRVTLPEAKALIRDSLAKAADGWAASVTQTAGLETEFGPAGVKVSFRAAAAVAARIPVEDPGASEPPAASRRTPRTAPEPELAGAADDVLPPGEAGPLLRALGLVGDNGQVRRDDRRKYNQITHLLRLLDGLARQLPSGREALVVDCGCGKSQLLFVLDYWLTQRLGHRAFFVGLDAEPQAVATARNLQSVLGYRNMEFVESTIAGWLPPRPPDLVLSLHACDTATDEAIALGIRSGSTGIVAVPCCQHELAGQAHQEKLDAVFGRHPILLDRFGDWLTDSLRALALEAFGYAVDVVEYVSPLDTPKNIMIRAVKARRPDHRAFESYVAVRDLFGVRPALDRLLSGAWPEALV